MSQLWNSQIDTLATRYMGRVVSHWTLRYIFDRGRVWMYQRRHPNKPWLTAEAIAVLESALRKSDNGIEWGAGRSTAWFAEHTKSLLSIESNQEWYDRVTAGLKERGLTNITCKLIPALEANPEDPFHAQYVEADPQLAPESLDYALVDAAYRDECALRAVQLLKPGGLLILDNANWFIPHVSRSPFSVVTASTRLWSEFLFHVATWRLIWTSNGVWDTALWFKTV